MFNIILRKFEDLSELAAWKVRASSRWAPDSLLEGCLAWRALELLWVYVVEYVCMGSKPSVPTSCSRVKHPHFSCVIHLVLLSLPDCSVGALSHAQCCWSSSASLCVGGFQALYSCTFHLDVWQPQPLPQLYRNLPNSVSAWEKVQWQQNCASEVTFCRTAGTTVQDNFWAPCLGHGLLRDDDTQQLQKWGLLQLYPWLALPGRSTAYWPEESPSSCAAMLFCLGVELGWGTLGHKVTEEPPLVFSNAMSGTFAWKTGKMVNTYENSHCSCTATDLADDWLLFAQYLSVRITSWLPRIEVNWMAEAASEISNIWQPGQVALCKKTWVLHCVPHGLHAALIRSTCQQELCRLRCLASHGFCAVFVCQVAVPAFLSAFFPEFGCFTCRFFAFFAIWALAGGCLQPVLCVLHVPCPEWGPARSASCCGAAERRREAEDSVWTLINRGCACCIYRVVMEHKKQ